MRSSTFVWAGMMALGLALGIVEACTTFGAEGGDPPDAAHGPDGPDGTTGLDGSSGAEASVEAGPDPATQDAGACRVPEGTASPCAPCEVSKVTDVTIGQWAFSLVADPSHLYWIENADRDGNALGGSIKRISIRGGDGGEPTPELVWFTLTATPTRLALLDDEVLVAFAPNQAVEAVRLPKSCDTTCTPTAISGSQRVRAITSQRKDPVTIESAGVRIGGSFFALPSPNRAGADVFGGEVAVVREGSADLTVSSGTLLPSGRTFPLADPSDGGTSRGAFLVSSDCERLWALQPFGAGAYALVATKPDAAAPSVASYFTRETFDMVADRTHVYLAHSDGPGLFRGSFTEAPRQLVSGDVWSIAVTNKYVYFDHHHRQNQGTRRIERILKSAP